MGDRKNYREDEHDVNFDDTREFAYQRWTDALATVKLNLAPADLQNVSTHRDWRILHEDIRTRRADRKTSQSSKRLLNAMQSLPRSVENLVGSFAASIRPQEADFNVLWGLMHLNNKLSCASTEKLSRTANWAKKLRSTVELFNRCVEACEQDVNEARLAMTEVLEAILQIFADSVNHLQQYPTGKYLEEYPKYFKTDRYLTTLDAEANREWKSTEITINELLSDIEWTVKHLSEITNYSKYNQEKQIKNLEMRHAPVAQPEETASFPIKMISKGRNEEFYGRIEELDRINRYLDFRGNTGLRTYTIYGRRGVGKTDLAREYAERNPAGFDAIFWVDCETSLSLRHSFTNMAVELNLPGADRNGHHEENQLAVLKWLKITRKKWLLIFDNAERESILNGYWPIGSVGAILITSRKYYNFMKDSRRKGDTVKPFDSQQSWELLIKLLGPHWEDLDRKGLIKVSEERAAKEFIEAIGGLALAITQAAQLIKDENVGGSTIESTYNLFKEHMKNLPPRVAGDRSDIIHALDALWNVTFNSLSRNARTLMSVLSLLSPDGMLIDLFLPKNQKALDGKLAFCKQHPDHIDAKSHAALSSVITPTAPLRAAIDELIKTKLIREDLRTRELWAHRVVQEAMNYHSVMELQEYFDSASALIYEAFPKQERGDYFSGQWGRCQAFISHGAHLSMKYAHYEKGGKNKLKGSPEFIKLLSNCAWYLYEISDYRQCLRVVETAWMAVEDSNTLQYATLCNIAGGAYYELNRLNECRKNWEMFYRLQQELLEEDDLIRSISYHNMGNLESADGNLEQAMEYFDQAIRIRRAAGDESAALLALSLLCKARNHFLLNDYDEAFRLAATSEALFVRISGSADNHFLSHVHYIYGNIEYAKKEWNFARQSYDRALKIGLINAPIHPITAAAYYSLGCCEYELKRNEHAKAYLEKALAIAQLRSPNRDDGTMARIMWKMSVVLYDDTYGGYIKEADALRNRAEVARQNLTANGEGGLVIAIDEDGNEDVDEIEQSYDNLVPGYFR